MASIDQRKAFRGDALCALLLALVLSLGWAWKDWPALSALRLPDTDDMMRLQQIRDWIGGQGFADLTQHRLGAGANGNGGLAMHWSRLPDLVPAAIIVTLTPALGPHTAELVAVLLWPAMLFGTALLLVARIARALGGDVVARTAVVVAAVAYPATTIFLPGRIDHHGLQIVLLLFAVRTLFERPTIGLGLAAGFAATASLVIGLETMPLFAAIGMVLAAEWLVAQPGADDRMMGFGIAIGAGLLAASIVFRPDAWAYPSCDGFTAEAWRAGVTAAFAPMAMALAARDITRPAKRAVLGLAISALIGLGIVLVAPGCLHPYGAVDPLVARLWLAHVGEAQPLFASAPATAIGYAGVMAAGIAATAWRLHATRDARWGALLVLLLAAFALTCFQLRGAYAGAMLAAPGLAAAIAAARARGSTWLVATWIASAGMLYPIAAQGLVPAAEHAAGAGVGACTAPGALAALAALPPGKLLAPLDLGAYAIGATRLSVVGAPYHRGTAGTLAVYRFYLGAPDRSAAIARDWGVRYVAVCADGFADAAPGATVTALRRGQPPRWLRPLPTRDPALTLYRVEPRLFPAATAR